ncbi:hypothetical protein NDU88_002832 [Pleurodeles waltl]|uniref:Uncharacterized protein n=1 Tax=Pleurodeles waltl TaxID=8319 RepID=A0AAV7LDL0_PLEWA|nr:hypothetical protein NDU88_002832 [Pleurodeles waltl]
MGLAGVHGPRGARLRHKTSAVGGGVAAGTAEAVAHAPDLEQLIQERHKALQLAVAISTSPRMSESDTDISQPPSDRPATPERLSELGFQDCPAVTPATADDLFQALLRHIWVAGRYSGPLLAVNGWAWFAELAYKFVRAACWSECQETCCCTDKLYGLRWCCGCLRLWPGAWPAAGPPPFFFPLLLSSMAGQVGLELA